MFIIVQIFLQTLILKGEKRKDEYIATQSPLAATSEEFWWMVWEQKVSVIVMLKEHNQVNICILSIHVYMLY